MSDDGQTTLTQGVLIATWYDDGETGGFALPFLYDPARIDEGLDVESYLVLTVQAWLDTNEGREYRRSIDHGVN